MAAVAATVDTKTVKGVMLCDRPPQNNDDNVNYGTALDTTHKYKPFLPTSSNVANEQLGLTPAYKVNVSIFDYNRLTERCIVRSCFEHYECSL